MENYIKAIGTLLGSADKLVKTPSEDIMMVEAVYCALPGEFCPEVIISYPIGEEGEEEFKKVLLISKEDTLKNLVQKVIECSQSLGTTYMWDESKQEDTLFYGYGIEDSNLVMSISGKYEDVEQWISQLAET
jgi:hypothetical protein